MTGVVTLLEKLINIPSPTGAEGAVGEFIAEDLRDRGFVVKKQEVEEGRFNVFASSGEKPKVLFCTHMDVVSPHIGFSLEGQIIKGRGACDAKGSLAAMIIAAELLAAEGLKEFGVLVVVGEERNSDGARMATGLDLGSEYVIVGEPTEGFLARGQKGTLVFRLKASGKPGHSAYPELGKSAIHEMVDVLGAWRDTEWDHHTIMGSTTLNIGVVGGGLGPNVIADEAYAEGIFRISTSVARVMEKVRTALTSEVEFEVLSSSEPLEFKILEGFEHKVVSFGSDAPYLKALGKPLLFGPGSIRHAHTEDEQIRVSELENAVETFAKIGKLLVTKA